MNAIAEDTAPAVPLKLDIGCGKNKLAGFHGVDAIQFDGVDTVLNVAKRSCLLESVDGDGPLRYRYEPWPWADNSIAEAHTSHFVEHLDAFERIHFFNELYRVLKPNATCKVITPYWASSRAYGDPTHAWPPIGEFFFMYLSRDWRTDNAPHCDSRWVSWGYSCHFFAVGGYGMNEALLTRTVEYQNFAIQNYKEAALDMHMTVTAIK